MTFFFLILYFNVYFGQSFHLLAHYYRFSSDTTCSIHSSFFFQNDSKRICKMIRIIWSRSQFSNLIRDWWFESYLETWCVISDLIIYKNSSDLIRDPVIFFCDLPNLVCVLTSKITSILVTTTVDNFQKLSIMKISDISDF